MNPHQNNKVDINVRPPVHQHCEKQSAYHIPNRPCRPTSSAYSACTASSPTRRTCCRTSSRYTTTTSPHHRPLHQSDISRANNRAKSANTLTAATTPSARPARQATWASPASASNTPHQTPSPTSRHHPTPRPPETPTATLASTCSLPRATNPTFPAAPSRRAVSCREA